MLHELLQILKPYFPVLVHVHLLKCLLHNRYTVSAVEDILKLMECHVPVSVGVGGGDHGADDGLRGLVRRCRRGEEALEIFSSDSSVTVHVQDLERRSQCGFFIFSVSPARRTHYFFSLTSGTHAGFFIEKEWERWVNRRGVGLEIKIRWKKGRPGWRQPSALGAWKPSILNAVVWSWPCQASRRNIQVHARCGWGREHVTYLLKSGPRGALCGQCRFHGNLCCSSHKWSSRERERERKGSPQKQAWG